MPKPRRDFSPAAPGEPHKSIVAQGSFQRAESVKQLEFRYNDRLRQRAFEEAQRARLDTTEAEVQEFADVFEVSQLSRESTFDAGEAARQFSFVAAENTREDEFREAHEQRVTEFHRMQTDLQDRARADALSRQVGFETWVQEKREELGHAEEASVTRYETDEVSRMAQFRYLVRSFRRAHPEVGPGLGDSSPVSESHRSQVSHTEAWSIWYDDS